MALLLVPNPSINRPLEIVSIVAAPIAIDAGLLEKILIIEEPIFGFSAFCETIPNIEKFSIPQVSGIQIVSALEFDKTEAQSKTSLIDKRDPKLHDNLIRAFTSEDILVFPLNRL